MFDDEMINDMKVYLKGRKILNDTEVEAIKPLILADYKKQKKLKVEDRKGYFSHEGADYLYFKTDPEGIPDPKNEGKYKNDIKKTKNDNWQYWARFPLKTSESASSPARITIYDESKDMPKWCKLKMFVGAKGRMNFQYRRIGSEEYPKYLKPFVEEFNEFEKSQLPEDEQENYKYMEFSQIDKSDYIISYNFNLDQVLEMKRIK